MKIDYAQKRKLAEAANGVHWRLGTDLGDAYINDNPPEVMLRPLEIIAVAKKALNEIYLDNHFSVGGVISTRALAEMARLENGE